MLSVHSNGDYITYAYDLLDRPIRKVYYNGDGTVQAEYLYVYSADGQLAKQYAISGGNVVEEYSFEYDSLGRLIRSREDKGSSNVQRTEHLYDTANRLTKQRWNIGGKAFTESYTYNAGDGSLNTFTAPTNDTLTYQYDALKRVNVVTVKDNEDNDELFYSVRDYKKTGNQSTNQISAFAYRNASGGIINYNTYEYDEVGNIKKIYQVTSNSTQLIAEYSYDSQNQLVAETYGGTTYQYSYDTAGNLLKKSTNGIVLKEYTYGSDNWQDLLTAYEDNSIYYEGQETDRNAAPTSGNPITWYNGSSYTDLTWAQGRRLMSLKKGSAQIEYAYDMDGIRTSKVEGSNRHDYVTQNGKVVRELVTNKTTGAFVRCLDFFYDASGNPFAMRRYNNSALTSYDTFHYVLNAQGDVVQINYQGGTVYAKYTYDAWGKVLTATGSLASINPLRYRGYYYDTETGWYYLQSRYYDPAVGRFINADEFASTGQGFIGYNMFAYCGNNPILNLNVDYDGFNYTATIGWTSSMWSLTLIDAWLPIGDIIYVGGIIVTALIDTINLIGIDTITKLIVAVPQLIDSLVSENTNSVVVQISSKIDWGDDNLHNHILKGSFGRHVSGWKKFGFDPNGGNGWQYILPFLKEVVDNPDLVSKKVNSDGSTIYYYIKYFGTYGQELLVKVWESANSAIIKLSDAWPS